jgi:hypothetical protein
MRFLRPTASIAAKCSLVWGCGQVSFAAITSMAPSMTAAPLSIVAINISCPGASTKLIVLWSSASPPQLLQISDVQ